MKKLLAKTVLMVTVIGLISQPAEIVQAKTVTKSVSKPSDVNFKNAWEKTTEIWFDDTQAMIGELCYGFDTYATDEDYTWARSWVYKHKAKVKNSNGTYESSTRNKSTSNGWAKKEVKHKGSSQKYYIVLTNVASSETASDFSKRNTHRSNNKLDD